MFNFRFTTTRTSIAALLLLPALAQAAEAPPASMGRRLPQLDPSQMQPLSLSRPFRVVIDPGHGGSDYGTIYSDRIQRVSEKDVTLSLARRVASELRSRGISVYLTRDSDTEV